MKKRCSAGARREEVGKPNAASDLRWKSYPNSCYFIFRKK